MVTNFACVLMTVQTKCNREQIQLFCIFGIRALKNIEEGPKGLNMKQSNTFLFDLIPKGQKFII